MKSRLTEVEKRKTLRTIAWSLLFVLALSAVLFYFGVPLLIKMAVFISELKAPSTSQEYQQEILQAPVFDALPEATPSASIIASGFAPPKSSIVVRVNDKELPSTLASDDGSFKMTIDLAEGDNTIVAKSKNDTGDESIDSKTWTVIRDATPPELIISNPIDNSTVSGEANKTIHIQGKTEAGATVTINNRLVLTSSDGSFTNSVTLSQGSNAFDILATDKAGNQTLSHITVNWQL